MSLTKASFSMITGACVNVLDYGAVGDFNFTSVTGTNNSAAFQAAVDALPNGGQLYIPHGYYLLSSSVVLTHGIEVVGDGQVNFNGYATVTPTAPNGGSLIVVANGVTAFTFDKGTDATSFGNSFRNLSFSSKVISEADYNDPPVFPANTNAINLSYTAELLADNVGFMNLSQCFYNTSGELTVKNYFSNIFSKDCGYTFRFANLAADQTITSCSAIKNNYFLAGTSVDGVTLTNSTIYRSYGSAVLMPDLTGDNSSFVILSGNKFFESGDGLVIISDVDCVTVTGNQFVRAGLVTDTAQTGLTVNDCETVTVSGNTVERAKGDGVYMNNNRWVEFDGTIMESGWGIGGATGLTINGCIVANISAAISCSGGSPAQAAVIESNRYVGGTITTDDIIRGQTTNIAQVGVESATYTVGGGGLVIPASGNQSIAAAVPYTLESYQSAIIYDIVFTAGGTGVGMSGLVFRVNSNFDTVLDGTGQMELRKEIEFNNTAGTVSNTFDVYLNNSGGSSFTVPAGATITFLWKVIQKSLPTWP